MFWKCNCNHFVIATMTQNLCVKYQIQFRHLQSQKRTTGFADVPLLSEVGEKWHSEHRRQNFIFPFPKFLLPFSPLTRVDCPPWVGHSYAPQDKQSLVKSIDEDLTSILRLPNMIAQIVHTIWTITISIFSHTNNH